MGEFKLEENVEQIIIEILIINVSGGFEKLVELFLKLSAKS